jgi:putative oxidoreductase
MTQWVRETSMRTWAILPLRLIVGIGFVAHGMAKWSRGPENFGKLLAQIGVPFPLGSAWLVTLLETLGGVAVFIGAYVELAAIPLIATMLVAMFTVHWRFGFSAVKTIGLTADGPVFGPPGYEIDLLYVGALLTLIIAGAGPLAAASLRMRASKASPRDPE